MTTLSQVLDVLEGAYPLHWAEDWDCSGLVLGDRGHDVTSILLAVDPTVAVARQAVASGAQLLITHHPLLLRGVSFLPADTGKGAVATTLLQGGCALWCGHTNVDRSSRGTVGAWRDLLGLQTTRPLVESAEVGAEADFGSRSLGLGVIGELPEGTTVGKLAQRIAAAVPATVQGIRYTGEADRPVRTVAVCPGAGDSLLEALSGTEADVYITSDLRHHPALEHVESVADAAAVPALIDVAHWASEALWLPLAERLLRESLPEISVQISTIRTDPWQGHVPS